MKIFPFEEKHLKQEFRTVLHPILPYEQDILQNAL